MLFAPLAQIPKNDPNGIWEADGGTQFEFHLSGPDLHVRLVPGSNPLLVSYEVDLKNQEEVNTYAGTGFFVAKMKEEECRYDVDWKLVVANDNHVVAEIPTFLPASDTCEVKQRITSTVELVKK
jgi:hypothetical protein